MAIVIDPPDDGIPARGDVYIVDLGAGDAFIIVDFIFGFIVDFVIGFIDDFIIGDFAVIGAADICGEGAIGAMGACCANAAAGSAVSNALIVSVRSM